MTIAAHNVLLKVVNFYTHQVTSSTIAINNNHQNITYKATSNYSEIRQGTPPTLKSKHTTDLALIIIEQYLWT
jgi:hypothetical protein